MNRSLALFLAAAASLVALLSGVAAATSLEFTAQKGTGFYTTAPRNKSVAVIWDAVDDSLAGAGGNANVFRYTLNQSQGRLFAALKEQGATVDFYRSTYFRDSDTDNAPGILWRRIGEKYGVVMVMNMYAYWAFLPASTPPHFVRKFFCPDSFSTDYPKPQLIHVGCTQAWREDSNAVDATAQARAMGTCSYAGVGNNVILAGTSTADSSHFAFLTPRGDSIGFSTAAYGVAQPVAKRATGVASVVQLFRPTANAPAVDADRLIANTTVLGYPGPISTLYQDSVATDKEVMPIAWRVYWNSGRWVDFSVVDMNNSAFDNTGHVTLALVNRYLSLDPLPVSYEWDDHGTFGVDDTGGEINGRVTYQRWPKQSTMTPWIAQLDSMGVKWNTTGPGDSLYRMATTTQNGKTYPYLLSRGSRMPFVPHVHDTIETHPLGIVTGRGTHQAAIGSSAAFFHRYAFRYNPGASLPSSRYGIYDRLRLQDSTYTALFGSGRTAPYLSFCNDISAPLDYRVQNNGGDGTCPPDSFFLALAMAGKTTIRGYVDGQSPDSTGHTTAAVLNTALVINRPFTYAGQQVTVEIPSTLPQTGDRALGSKQTIRCIGTTTSGVSFASPANARSKTFRSAAQQTIPRLLHIMYTRPSIAGGNAFLGENQATQVALGLSNKNDDTAWIGMYYQHPGIQAGATPWTALEMTKEEFRVSVRDPLAALSGIAGHDFWRWVYPWELRP